MPVRIGRSRRRWPRPSRNGAQRLLGRDHSAWPRLRRGHPGSAAGGPVRHRALVGALDRRQLGQDRGERGPRARPHWRLDRRRQRRQERGDVWFQGRVCCDVRHDRDPDFRPVRSKPAAFELLAGNDGPRGTFRSVGVFTTENILIVKTPFQSFTCDPVTARVVKIPSTLRSR